MSSTLLSEHGLHFGTILGPALLLAFWAGWGDLRRWLHRRGDALPGAVLFAALLSGGAAAAHLVVVPAHAGEDPLYGVFFAATAAAQLAWAVAVVRRPSAGVLAVGALGSVVLVGLWAVTRTVGVPLGAATGAREAVGALDLTTVLLELAVVVCCARTVGVRHTARTLAAA